MTTGAPSGACPTDPREPRDGGAWKRGALLQIKGRGRRGPQGAFDRLQQLSGWFPQGLKEQQSL